MSDGSGDTVASDAAYDSARHPAGLRRLIRYFVDQYVNALDEQQLRRIGNPWAMAAAAVLLGGTILAMEYVPWLQRATGLRHSWLIASLSICGYVTNGLLHFARGRLFWLLNLATASCYATPGILFAMFSQPPASTIGLIAYASTLVIAGTLGAFNWIFLIVFIVCPFAVSLWAPPERILPVLVLVAFPLYFQVAAGAGRQRKLVAQRDALRNAQLVQANRLAALGRLSAGLAHELNQHIFSVRGFAQRLRRDSADKPGSGGDELRMIEEATDHMSRVIANVRRLSRAEKPQRNPIDPTEPLKLALGLMDRQLKAHAIVVHWRANAAPSVTVRADPVELEQVFLNLIHNARDALCTLPTTVTRRLDLGVEIHGDQVLLSIEDNGPGIAQEHQNKLFEQGFTTKDASGGSGIGLWISQSFVKGAGGNLRFEPVSTGGARFLVEMPRVDAGPGAQADGQRGAVTI